MSRSFSWISGFLRADGRGLTEPDGRHLFRYRCTEAEYRELRSRLAEDLRPVAFADAPSPFFRAFAFYASEWFRREFRGGVWRWADMLQSIGAEESDQQDFTRAYARLESAFEQFWRRPLHRSAYQREFLVTAVREGGLPLALIASDERSRRTISQFVAMLLETVLTTGEQSLAAFARSRREGLPQLLRDEVILGNMCGLATVLAAWRERLRGTAPELLLLDPDFRNSLPLELSDEIASGLARTLLADAKTVVDKTDVGAPSHAMTLRRVGTRWELSRTIHLPQRARPQGLGMPTAALTRGRLYAENESRHRVVLTDFYEGGHPVIALARGGATIELPSTMMEGSLELVAGSGGVELGRAPFIALSELPWCFREREDGAWTYVGDGSRRTVRDTLLTLVPPDFEVEGDPDVRELAQGIAGRRLLEIRGTVVLTNGVDRCRLSTGSPQEDDAQFVVAGARSSLGLGDAYAGPPRIFRLGTPRQEETVVLWRPDGLGARPRRLDGSCFGRGWILLQSPDGDTRFRQHATILPIGARIRGSHPRGGPPRLFAEGFANATLQLSTGARPVADGALCVFADLPAEPGASIALEIRWPDGAAATIPTRTPGRAGRFLLRDGTALENGAAVALDRLNRVRAEVVTTDGSERFELHATFVPPPPWPGRDSEETPFDLSDWSASFQLVPDADDGRVGYRSLVTHSLDLGAVEDEVGLVLSSVRAHEAGVRLEIRQRIGLRLPPVTLNVVRYDGTLQRDGNAVFPVSNVGEATPPGLAVRAQPLDSVSTPPIELPRGDDGRWSTDDPRLAPGPWLITAWDGSVCRYRPLLVTRRGDPTDAAAPRAGSLSEAIRIADAGVRRARLAALFGEMANAPDHPDWKELFAYLATLDSLPANTFDVVVAVTEAPDICASALLRTDTTLRATVMDALERLPFMWHLIPIASWDRAIGADQRRREELRNRRVAIFREAGLEVGDSAPSVREQYDRLQKELIARNRGLHGAVRRGLVEVGFADEDRRPIADQLTLAYGIWRNHREAYRSPRELGIRVPADLPARAPLIAQILSVPAEVTTLAEAGSESDLRSLYVAPRLAAILAVTATPAPADQLLAMRRARGNEPVQQGNFDLVYTLVLDALLTERPLSHWSRQ